MKMKKVLAGLTAVLCMAGSMAVFPEMADVRAAEAVHNDFEVTYEGWYSDNATLAAVDGLGYNGTRGMQVTGRNSAADGVASSKGFYLWGGVDYTYSVQVKADTDETFHISLLTIDEETEEETLVELDTVKAKAGEWTKLSAKYEAPENSYEFKLAITTDSTADFYFDEVNINTKEDVAKVYAAPAGKGLKDEFANYFLVGNILNGGTVKNSAITGIILKDHNAIECENETKPDATINANGSTNTDVKVHLNGAAAILDFAVKNNLAFRGHTLVWHSQTPEWFFKEGFNDNGAYVSSSVMDQRMESYIKNMFALYKAQYPTLNLYAYDVCNEVVYDGTATSGGARPTQGDGRSAWVQVYGNNSFVEKAFTYARKYAPANCKLFYNDYNEFANDKQNCIINTILKPLMEKNLIDGMGMQSHVNCAANNAWGDTVSYLAAMDKYLELGLEVHVSELDLSTEGGKFSLQQQADKYKAIFKHAMDVNTSGKYKGGVTLVQVWGPNDANTWIKTENAPLLYDTNNQPKPAYTALTSLVPDSEWGDGSNPSVGGEVKPIEPNEFGWYFHHRFEGSDEDWTSRGGVTLESTTAEHYVESASLYVSGRTASWNGASYAISPRAFEPGNEYSFSVNVMYNEGDPTDTFFLKLEYTDAAGETQYSTIDELKAVKGEWGQLCNTNYKIPADATNMRIYVETAESTISFYMDEAIGAVAGTGIQGAGKPDIGSDIPGNSGKAGSGDVNGDGVIDVFDLTLAKRGVLKGFASTAAANAADVDQNGKTELADLVQMYKYIHRIINKFTVVEKPVNSVDTAKMESIFASVSPASSWKKDGENNPLTTQRFGADPGFLVYKDRLYVYTTNDAFEYDSNGKIKENTYDVGTINCVSSSDLVNWTDHGAIPVADRNGRTQNGAAKWASASWAPDACWKTINGKDKFFLYFANSAGGIGVLTADSPEGPWTDPIGQPLITKQTANCGDVEWMFDPAVFVDDDGTGYIYFGGGVPSGKQSNPGTGRCAKLGDDMISLAGDPVRMETPYLFEDSSVLKIGKKYYYSYCTNWNVPGGTNVNGVSFANADICYMVADNPLGPWTSSNLKGNVFKNTGTQRIDNGGNNHHSIVCFKDKYYVLYHSRQQEIRMGVKTTNGQGQEVTGGNYRSTQLNEATYNAATGEITCNGDMKGVAQLETLNPYTTVQAETMSNQSDNISVTGLGNTVVDLKKGSWIKTSGVAFSGTSKLTVKASSAGGAALKVCAGSPTGDVIGYVEIPAGGMTEVTVPVNNISGTKDVYFVASGDMSFDSWVFAK